MEWQQQGEKECFPTSVAMLAEVSKDEVLADASLYVFGDREASKDWQLMRTLRGVEIHKRVIDTWAPWIQLDSLFPGANFSFLDSLGDDFHGQGLALWRGIYGGFHATAFKDGQIYDPAGGIRSPESLINEGWDLISVQRKPEKA